MGSSAGHRRTGRVRRGVIALAVVVLAGVAGGGWLAIGASGQDPRPVPARAAAATAPAPAATPRPAATPAPDAGLPPLPEMRGTVVEPRVGGSGGSGGAGGNGSAPARGRPAAADPGLADPGPAPTAPATAGARPVAGAAAPTGSVTRAAALPNGIAVPPLEAPAAVKRMIEAGNVIARAPYLWGGGHGRWIDKGYDCSGSVSFVLAAAGYLQGPLDSGHLAGWGEPGPGAWVTIYANAGHVFMEVAGIRFDTSGQRVTGSRWQNAGRPTAGFAVRHPPGL